MRMLKKMRKLLYCMAFACIYSSIAFGDVSCPSGWTSVTEDDSIYITSGSCSANHVTLGGDISLSNCIDATSDVTMCTFFDTPCQPGKYFDGTSFQTCLAGTYCDGNGTAVPGTSGCSVSCPGNSASVSGTTACTCNTGYNYNGGTTTTTAACTVNTYTITYELDSGVNSATNPSSYTIESDTIVLAEPTRDGYTFAGWTENGTSITEITTGTTGDKTLVAQWTECGKGYYCADGVKTACTTYGAGYTTDSTTATSASDCYQPCTTQCTQQTCPSNATCTHGASTTSGKQYYGGTCDASASTCSLDFTCNENFEKVDGACKLIPEFTIETLEMEAGSTFSFNMSAKGIFYVDCGDGGTLSGNVVSGNTITRNDTTNAQYTCKYPTAGTHTIRFAGSATGYTTANNTAAISFSGNKNIKTVDGSLGAIFSGNSKYMFYYTFNGCTALTSIPENLFAGVKGRASDMFSYTFSGCESLTSIPENLFAGVSGSADTMFNRTFENCTSLTNIPENLFAGVSGSANGMFEYTFKGCTSLTSIPEKLFAGVKGSAIGMFGFTFYNCTSLTSIPENLFAGVSGSASVMFQSTFEGCTSLTSIPENLFAGVSGSAYGMFSSTFKNCTSLTSIPENLFEGVSGGEGGMFGATFYNCTSLTSIPENLFAGVSGSADLMFDYTFGSCTSLTSLPDGLFKNIEGKPAYRMFYRTFYGCRNLSGYIPANTFAKMDSTDFDSAAMTDIFNNTELDETCPSGTYQYSTGFEDAWNGKVACTSCPESHPNSVEGATSQDQCYTSCTTQCVQPTCPDNAQCSYGNESADGHSYYGIDSCDATAPTCSITFTCNENFEKVDGACKLIPEFTIETTNMSVGSTFSFDISASGTFYVDCGDGGTLTGTGVSGNTITRNDTTNAQYTCTYQNSGTHKILFAGEATGYNGTNAAISFEENANIVSLGGSLGAIFGGSANNMFNSAFYKSTSLETIPETLFEGVTGSAKNMFRSVFNGCTSLKSIPSGLFAGVFDGAENMFYLSFANCALLESIPDGLFAGITTGAERMFHGTFYGCSLLNNLPSDLFGGLNGTNAQYLFSYTFQDCSSLESIPSGLFNGVSGNAPYMFEGTFQNNTLLRAIESDLFANVSGGAEMMFHGTFYGCKSLESIPKNLFAGITESASNMFKETFMGCTSLQTIPENLFAGITTGAEKMFLSTFDACSGLVSLPSGLFRNITGKPAIDMFDYTFYDCSGLTGYIPSNMFEKMDSTGFEKTSMTRIFYNTPNLATTCPAGTTQDITGFESAWDGKVACTPCPESHPNSVEGATSQNQCYTSCTTQCTQPTCPDNAICSYGNESASGNSYYGTDSCDATAPTCSMEFVCNDGYQKNDAGNACVIVEYDIIYELNGGVNSESNPVKYNVETDTLTLLAPKRSGYSFVGWYDNAEFAGEPVTQIIRASTNHKSFYAKWNECAIGYYCLDGVKTKCPDGFTSKIGADSADDCNIKLKKLHIGKDTLYLTPNKPDVSPLMAFGIGDEVYYGGLSEIEQTLHDNATTKYNVLMDDKQRYLYDLTAD